MTEHSKTETRAVYKPECGEGYYILTPPPNPCVQIHGPSRFGVRPGSPFLYTIPVTGTRPVSFFAEGLPAGLYLDKQGIIRGTITDHSMREYTVQLGARNEWGEAEKTFTIAVGDLICLTPPLGWNSWNCWKFRVNHKRVLDSARAMVEKGLADCGWTYINIDDGWQSELRGGKYNAIQPAPTRFPDMGKLCREIHALGLKVGIYSSPWITTYGGHIGGSSDHTSGLWERVPAGRQVKKFWRVGRWSFEVNDAAQWAEWGIDYLKYDWYGNDRDSTVRMADALRGCGRDVVYSLSNSACIENADVYLREANCWRTAGDLKDRWDQDGVHLNLRDQWECHRYWLEEGSYGGSGHFPDADMLVIGHLREEGVSEKLRPSRLTPDEQYSHISLWTLWASPMLIGSPIEQMDAFTLALLTNTEVLAVHQDAFAVPGKTVRLNHKAEIVVKMLENGDRAVGLFNTSESPQTIVFDLKYADVSGRHRIRDLWRQQDIGVYSDQFAAEVRPHGVILVRVTAEG